MSTIFRVIALLLLITNVTLLILNANGWEQAKQIASYVVPVDLLFIVFAVFGHFRAYVLIKRKGERENLFMMRLGAALKKCFQAATGT